MAVGFSLEKPHHHVTVEHRKPQVPTLAIVRKNIKGSKTPASAIAANARVQLNTYIQEWKINSSRGCSVWLIFPRHTVLGAGVCGQLLCLAHLSQTHRPGGRCLWATSLSGSSFPDTPSWGQVSVSNFSVWLIFPRHTVLGAGVCGQLLCLAHLSQTHRPGGRCMWATSLSGSSFPDTPSWGQVYVGNFSVWLIFPRHTVLGAGVCGQLLCLAHLSQTHRPEGRCMWATSLSGSSFPDTPSWGQVSVSNFSFLHIKREPLDEIHIATEREEKQSCLKNTIMKEWPPNKDTVPIKLNNSLL